MTESIRQTRSNPYLGNRSEEQVKVQAEMLELAEAEKKEDAVKKDVKRFNIIFSKFSAQLSSKLEYLTTKITKGCSVGFDFLRGLIDEQFLKKLVRMFLIIFFLMVLIFVGIKLTTLLKEKGGRDLVSQPTTAPALYQSYQPSIYAEDSEVLRLEKDLGMLEREIVGFNLKESFLNLPSLDFEISF